MDTPRRNGPTFHSSASTPIDTHPSYFSHNSSYEPDQPVLNGGQALHPRPTEYDQIKATKRALLRKFAGGEEMEHGATSDIARLRESLASWNDMPQEVLSIIFAYSMPDEPPHVDPSSHPWSLSQVCRLWRSTAWYTRELWSDAHIFLTMTSLAFPTRTLAFAEEWLGRSGNRLLNLHISADSTFDRHQSPLPRRMVRDMLSLLSRFMDRCQTFSMAIAMDPHHFDFPFPPNGFLPHLHTLQFRPPPGARVGLCTPSTLRVPWTGSFLAPELRVVRAQLFTGLSGLYIPWSLLTELALEDCDVSQYIAIDLLRRSTNLVTCKLIVSDEYYTERQNNTTGFVNTLDLPHLEHLVLVEHQHMPVSLRLPKLKTLEYQANAHSMRVAQIAVHAPLLTTLIFSARIETRVWREDIFPYLPNLQVLAERPVGLYFTPPSHPLWRVTSRDVFGTFKMAIFDALTPREQWGGFVTCLVPALEEIEGFLSWDELYDPATRRAWELLINERIRLGGHLPGRLQRCVIHCAYDRWSMEPS